MIVVRRSVAGWRSIKGTRLAVPFICMALVSLPVPPPTTAEDLTPALRAYLQRCVEAEKIDFGIVVGLVDDQGSRTVSYGKLGNGTNQEVNGDTVFEIGSITKTFTGLLLQDMVERGEMKLDDPVARYLPKSVKVPTHNGKEITLLHLATHTSGLPTVSVTWTPKRAEDPRADYTLKRLYDFVSGCRLTCDPGTKYEYCTAGMALLGQAIALKAGTSYESLVVERICRPLGMDSTRITLTRELKDRLAIGHNYCGYAVSSSYWGALVPGAAIRSTANDLLKYLSATLGLTSSSLTPVMAKTHVSQFHAGLETDTGRDTDLGLAWMITREPGGMDMIQHGGLTDGFITFICFDVRQHRGVVVLSNCQDFDVPAIGKLVLMSEWAADRRPREARTGSQVYDGYVGRYQTSPDSASWPGIGILREGDRLFVQAMGSGLTPRNGLLPPRPDELFSTSESEFYDRLSGRALTFSRDDRGKVTGLTVHYRDQAVSYDRTSEEPPKAPAPPSPRVAVTLDTELLDACVGDYEFAPGATYPAGMKLAIRRQGDRLVAQAWGQNAIQGAFDVFPESETEFFVKVDGARLTFVKDEKGQVTAVIHHSYRAKSPACEGKKVSHPRRFTSPARTPIRSMQSV